MNTWGKRSQPDFPDTVDELEVKRFKFGDCPVSMPTDCPAADNSVVVVQTDGTSTWAPLPTGPTVPPTEIVNTTNGVNTRVECLEGGVFMQVDADRFVFAALKTAIIGPPIGQIAMKAPNNNNSRLFMNDNGVIQLGRNLNGEGLPPGPGLLMDNNRIQVITANGPSPVADALLVAADAAGTLVWKPPGQYNLAADNVVAQVLTFAYDPDTGDGVTMPSTLPPQNASFIVANTNGDTQWGIPTRIQDVGDPNSFIVCDEDDITVSTNYPTGKLKLAIAATITPGQVLTATDAAGACAWVTQPVVNPFNQLLNTTNAVTFASINTPTLGGATTNVTGTLRVSNAFNMPTGTGTNTQVLTSNGAGGTAWQTPVAALGLTVTFGGSVNANNNFFRYDATYLTIVSSTLNEVGNVFVVPTATATLKSLSWDTTSATATTQLTIYKNGVLATLINLTGVRGAITAPTPPFVLTSYVLGDTIQVRLTAGTAPGNSTLTMYFT